MFSKALKLALVLTLAAVAAQATPVRADSPPDSAVQAVEDTWRRIYEKTGVQAVSGHNYAYTREDGSKLIRFGGRSRIRNSFLIQDISAPYSIEVILTDVTLENFEEKMREYEMVVIEQIRQIQLRNRKLDQIMKHGFELSNKSSMIETGVGAELAIGQGVSVASVWAQLPAVSAKNDGYGMTTRWIRTEVFVDGSLSRANFIGNETDRVLVTRITSSLFEMELNQDDGDFGTQVGVLRVGELDGAIRFDGVNPSSARLDVGLIGVKWGKSLPITDSVAAYFSTTLSFALRLIEENASTLRLAVNLEETIGVVINDRFFVQAGVAYEDDVVYQTNLSFRGDAGWRINDVLTVKAGVTYLTSRDGDDPIDPYYLVPQGWSFNVGALTRF